MNPKTRICTPALLTASAGWPARCRRPAVPRRTRAARARARARRHAPARRGVEISGRWRTVPDTAGARAHDDPTDLASIGQIDPSIDRSIDEVDAGGESESDAVGQSVSRSWFVGWIVVSRAIRMKGRGIEAAAREAGCQELRCHPVPPPASQPSPASGRAGGGCVRARGEKGALRRFRTRGARAGRTNAVLAAGGAKAVSSSPRPPPAPPQTHHHTHRPSLPRSPLRTPCARSPGLASRPRRCRRRRRRRRLKRRCALRGCSGWRRRPGEAMTTFGAPRRARAAGAVSQGTEDVLAQLLGESKLSLARQKQILGAARTQGPLASAGALVNR